MTTDILISKFGSFATVDVSIQKARAFRKRFKKPDNLLLMSATNAKLAKLQERFEAAGYSVAMKGDCDQ